MPGVAAVAIPAAASIAGAYLSNKAQKNAAKAQESAAEKAIAYEKEQQAARQSRYDAAYADYRQRYDQWLEQFYGVKPKTGGADVRASSGGGVGAPMGAPSVAPGTVSRVRPGDNIGDLMRQIGSIQANSAANSGNIWGAGIAQAGAGIGKAIGSRGEQQMAQQPALMGQFQPSGVAQPGMTPWQPAPMGRGPQDDWTNWQRYYGNPGM